MSEGIDSSILRLADEGLLSAVSALTIYERWPGAAQRLSAVTKSIDIGLHFCLTGEGNRPLIPVSPDVGYVGRSGFFLSPAGLFRQCLLGRLDKKAVAAELQAQYARFYEALGLPQHLDGHHHCHQWPGISGVFLDFAQNLKPAPVIRQTTLPLKALLHQRKLLLFGLSLLGALFYARLAARGLRSNVRFGMYANYLQFDKKAWFRALEKNIPKNSSLLWAVHPALHAEGIAGLDPHADERVTEHACLVAPELATILARANLQIAVQHER